MTLFEPVELSIQMKAFSINRFYCRDGKYVTKEGRAWVQELFYRLDELRPNLQPLIDAFNIAGGEFTMEMTCVYPSSMYRNKQGQISSKTFDLSNTEKTFIDVLFLQVMGVDDRFITKLVSTKCPGTEYRIDVRLVLETKA